MNHSTTPTTGDPASSSSAEAGNNTAAAAAAAAAGMAESPSSINTIMPQPDEPLTVVTAIDNNDNNNNNCSSSHHHPTITGQAAMASMDYASLYGTATTTATTTSAGDIVDDNQNAMTMEAQAQQQDTTTDNIVANNIDNMVVPEEEIPAQSVYETVLPQSIAFRPMAAAKSHQAAMMSDKGFVVDPLDPPEAPEGVTVMPLVAFLQDGYRKKKPPGWHRHQERTVRGLPSISAAETTTELEPWEISLATVEILLLGGGTPYANFQHLAHGWGQPKGFHTSLLQSVCHSRGAMIQQRKQELNNNNNNNNNAATTTTTTG